MAADAGGATAEARKEEAAESGGATSPAAETTGTARPTALYVVPVVCTILGVLVGAAFMKYTAPADGGGAVSIPAAAASSGAPAAAAATAPMTAPADAAEPPASLTVGMTFGPATRKRADWFFDHQMWPEAIAAYQQAIAAGVDNPDVRTDLGSAYRFAGQPKDALAQYQTAQRQSPRHENSLYNEAALYAFTLNDVPKAVALWKTYLERFPNGQGAPDVRRFLQAAQAGQPIPHAAAAGS